MRNSSLVEWRCAENLPGLSIVPKLWMCFKEHVVGERSKSGEVESRMLVILFAGALNTALDRKGAWAVWMFPALALCMLGGHISLACIVLRILPGKKRPRRDPASKIRWPLFCFGLCFAISGSFFIAAYLTAAVPQGQPWSPCLFAVPHVAIGVAFAVSAVRKPSKDAPEGEALPRTCPRCEATVPAGERICPRCGKRVRAGKAKAGT